MAASTIHYQAVAGLLSQRISSGIHRSHVHLSVLPDAIEEIPNYRREEQSTHEPTLLTLLQRGADVANIAFESPRGQVAMKWIAQYPDADMLHVRSNFGFSMLVPISPDGFRDLMGPAAYSVEKPGGIRQALSLSLGWGLILTEGDEHKRQRKALTPAFSLNNIRGLYGLMWRKAEEFSSCVKAVADKDGYVEIGSWAR